MRSSNLITILALLFTSNLFSQKVDIDNVRIPVEFSSLPSHFILPAQRTYTVDIKGDQRFDRESMYNDINIRGWEKIEEGEGDANVVLYINDFKKGQSKLETREQVKKNDEGKVISRKKYYKITNTITGDARLAMYGPENKYVSLYQLEKRAEKAAKAAKKSKKSKKSKPAPAANPFLKNVNLEPDEEEANSGRIAYVNLSNTTPYETKEFASSKLANEYYNRNFDNAFESAYGKFNNSLASRASYKANSIYSFNRIRERIRFKELDSKKHPEFEMHNNSIEALKAIFASKRFNKDNAELTEALTPLLNYFESLKEKYSQSDKNSKKLKSAALYNMAQIFYCLDMSEKVVEIGEEIVRFGEESKDGESFIRKGEKLAHELAFHHLKGRYFVTEEDADAVVVETTMDTEE